MKNTQVHIADQTRELTPDELHENFNEAAWDIHSSITELQDCLNHPETIPHGVGHDDALGVINSSISKLEALRYTIQHWKNQYQCYTIEETQENSATPTVIAYPDALLNVKEVAEYMGCDTSTVYRNHLKNGLVSYITQPGGVKKIRVKDLRDYCLELICRFNKKSA